MGSDQQPGKDVDDDYDGDYEHGDDYGGYDGHGEDGDEYGQEKDKRST